MFLVIVEFLVDILHFPTDLFLLKLSDRLCSVSLSLSTCELYIEKANERVRMRQITKVSGDNTTT